MRRATATDCDVGTLQSTASARRADTSAASGSESDVILGLRDELEACQQHLQQKKDLLAEALAQLKVFLKDEEMLESEIGENERLAEEIEDLKYDISQSERARKWLAQRLSATGLRSRANSRACMLCCLDRHLRADSRVRNSRELSEAERALPVAKGLWLSCHQCSAREDAPQGSRQVRAALEVREGCKCV
jgi:hypothetical protein